MEKHTREVHESLNKTKIHLVDLDPDNEDVLDKFNKMAISEAISVASKKEFFSKGKRKSLADLKDKAGQDHLDKDKDKAGQGHLDWIHSEEAIERMEEIMRGDFESHRHDLFLERQEREQCSGFRLSRLHSLSNPGYLGAGGKIDSAVIAWLEEVFEANVNTAEEKLQVIVDKSVGFTYATAVLFPETFIHQQEALGYSRDEAEALFLQVDIEEDEREALRREIKEAAKELEKEALKREIKEAAMRYKSDKRYEEDWVDHSDLDEFELGKVLSSFKELEKNIVRGNVLNNMPRIDGRDLDTVRPIFVETDVLPSAHGSALFTRGETQAIVVATLGSSRDAQRIESIEGEGTDNFMLHYNFPAYSVGEIGMPMGPKRREIGHGNLAKRAIKAVLPDVDEFGYTMRVVSEITESNGSSSMASVCGTSLSLMDAGVPLSSPVAGIAMGLIKEGDDFAVLTDILGDEDHLGDMDFKVAGTESGITALQMDIKIKGINESIMETALAKAKNARNHILGIMNEVISSAKDLSENAPAMKTFIVDKDKIKEIIGKGGAVIKGMQEKTGATVDVNDDGVVSVFGQNQSSMKECLAIIEEILEEPELNKVYKGRVVKIVEFGAFVNILPGKDGLLHISEISDERTENVSDVLEEDQEIDVKLIGFDRGKMKLSMKALSDKND